MQIFKKENFRKLLLIILLGIVASLLISCSDSSIVLPGEEDIEVIKEELKSYSPEDDIYHELIDKHVGQQLTDISLKDSNGKNIQLSEISKLNDEFILEFMAPWCPACINNVNSLEDINTSIKVINVSLSTESYSEIEEFIENSNSSLDYYLSVDDDVVLQNYELMYIPTAFYIKDGVILGVFDSIDQEHLYKIKDMIEEV